MLKQGLQQKLQQKLSPQQIQFMKLLQLPTLAFEERINAELEENPALEDGAVSEDPYEMLDQDYEADVRDESTIEAEDINVDEYLSDDEIPEYRLQANNYSMDDEEAKVPYAQGKSLNEYLLEQLHTYKLNEEEYQIADFLIGNIDEDGYIRRDLMAIVDDLAFTQAIYTDEHKLAEILQIIQQLDPPGVGARDLQECLNIQLSQLPESKSVRMAKVLVEKHFERFIKKHYTKILERMGCKEEELRDAIHEIEHLNPKPGNAFSGNMRNVEQVTPDFNIQIEDGELQLTLNGRNAPELKVSRQYNELFETFKQSKNKSKEQKDAVLFVKQKLDAAKWFIDAIKQRQGTLYQTMHAIMKHQEEFFLTGDEKNLKPMILRDIAERIGMDISTVSRVASSKYVNTPYGTFLLRDLFSESVKNEQGEDVSTKEIKIILQRAIGEEDKRKPLTDEKLMLMLKDKGYPIARRTVAKYREQLNIPVARLRKQI